MSFRHACLFLAATLLALPAARAQTTPLNDTGQTRCYDASNAEQDCDEATTGNTGARPRQDGRFGRDAQATKGTLSKTGGGAAGFDFTPLAMDGSTIGIGNDGKPVSAHLCVKDNVTGLVWSTETLTGDWDDAMNTAPGGYNTAARCGFNNWRVPTRRELLSIVHYGKASAPLIDENYFPGTASEWYWTSDEYAPDSTVAWFVYFYYGDTLAYDKADASRVRLVRGGE